MNNFEYPIKKYVWANNDYIYIREPLTTVRFIIKKLCDNRSLIEEDKAARERWIKIIKDSEGKKSYSEILQEALKEFG